MKYQENNVLVNFQIFRKRVNFIKNQIMGASFDKLCKLLTITSYNIFLYSM